MLGHLFKSAVCSSRTRKPVHTNSTASWQQQFSVCSDTWETLEWLKSWWLCFKASFSSPMLTCSGLVLTCCSRRVQVEGDNDTWAKRKIALLVDGPNPNIPQK